MKSILPLVLMLAACGGGGDDGSPPAPPAPTSPTTVTVLQVAMRDQARVDGPSISEYAIAVESPAFRLPAKATSAEACAHVEWVEYVSPTTITMATMLTGASPGGWEAGPPREVGVVGDYMLTAERCGQIDVSNPPSRLAIAMRVSTTTPAMARHAWLVRWTVKATVP